MTTQIIPVYRVKFYNRVDSEIETLDIVGAPGPIAAIQVFAEWAETTFGEISAGFLAMEITETTDEHIKAHRKNNGPQLKVVK